MYSQDFRRRICEARKAGIPVAKIAKDFKIPAKTVYKFTSKNTKRREYHNETKLEFKYLVAYIFGKVQAEIEGLSRSAGISEALITERVGELLLRSASGNGLGIRDSLS